MTARNQPHKYRCETCEYWDKSQFPHKWGCNKIKRWMDYSQVDWIIRVGCASHSDATKAEQRIEDLELTLRSIVREIDSPNDWETSLKNIKEEALALLREKEE